MVALIYDTSMTKLLTIPNVMIALSLERLCIMHTNQPHLVKLNLLIDRLKAMRWPKIEPSSSSVCM